MEAHAAGSLYSEEKAKLLRSIFDEVESADTELNEFLRSMALDEVPKADAHITLPEELIEVVAEVSVSADPGKELKAAMAKVSAKSADVEADLQEVSVQAFVECWSSNGLFLLLRSVTSWSRSVRRKSLIRK